METTSVKFVFALALHYLVLGLPLLQQFLQSKIRVVHCYANRFVKSPLVVKLNAWRQQVAQTGWYQHTRNVLGSCAAFIVGSTYEDERVAFTAAKLVKNDTYRDRLLAPEIEDLVVLSDALQLTLSQREAYFQCFLRIDFMRRSSISRAELLRYCDLRSTPLTSFLLPNDQEAMHRKVARHRWDIVQLMVVCFSVCTAHVEELIRSAVAEAIRPRRKEVGTSDEEKIMQGAEEERCEPSDKAEVVTQGKHGLCDRPKICVQIEQCFAFFGGVLTPVEHSLQTLLTALYESDSITARQISFQEIHRVSTIHDVARFFPVLVFPCIWTQRVLRKRILGAKTWQCLERRRAQLLPHLSTANFSVSLADIVAASQIQLQQKLERRDQLLRLSTIDDRNGGSTLSIALRSSRSGHNADSKKSIHRKVVPCSDVELASSYAVHELSFLEQSFDQCSSLEEAWRISANHALASVYVQCLREDPTVTREKLEAEFGQVTQQIFAGELRAEKCELIRQRLVRVYGYRFAHTLLAKSNVKELCYATKTPPDERRATERYAKAWRDCALVEDKLIYWKEFEDPVAKRAFYYNIRTGESRWEKPATFEGTNKASKRRKVNKLVRSEQEAQTQRCD